MTIRFLMMLAGFFFYDVSFVSKCDKTSKKKQVRNQEYSIEKKNKLEIKNIPLKKKTS